MSDLNVSYNRSNPVPSFRIGDKVNAVAFTDCFGKYVAARPGLTVSEVRLIQFRNPLETLKPYYRIKADEPAGFGYVEGAERYFELAVRS